MQVEITLHGRDGHVVLGLGSKNFFSAETTRPFEDYYTLGVSSRGHTLLHGKIVKEGGVPFGSCDRIGMFFDIDNQIYYVYKNGRCVAVGACPGVAFASLSQTLTFFKV